MISISTKQYKELRAALITNLGLDFFEDSEIDHILGEIEAYDVRVRQKVLALSLDLSHASSSFVPGALGKIKTASQFLSFNDLNQWLAAAFEIRDSQGIDQALIFLSRVSRRDLKAFQAREGFPLRDAAPMLETYLRAISGLELTIMPDREIYTDTENVFLPAVLNRFPQRIENFILYKLSAIYAWAQVAAGTLTLDVDLGTITGRFPDYPLARPDIEIFFGLFPERALALDLYTVIESFRIEYFLMNELPGLMKQAAGIKNKLYQERQNLNTLPEKSAFVEGLWQYYLTGKIKGASKPGLTEAVSSVYSIQYETGPKASVKLLYDFYNAAASLPGDYRPRPAPLFIPRIRPEKVSARLRERQAGYRKKLEGAISKLIEIPDFIPDVRNAQRSGEVESSPDISREYLLIKGRLLELDEDLKSVIDQKGGVPGGVLVKGGSTGGGSILRLTDLIEEQEVEPDGGGHKYDEWDYKRSGYKKRWCSLYEQDIHPGDEPFVRLTLARYAGYVSVLRKKFELLKREQRLIRRQSDGIDIDLDAVVESFSDLRAGASPSENLFIRADRHERNIAVLFLVDMSGSTRGWVNRAEKESLVLMSEALETLGDRYAVYGFSGNTRNRCDLYRVKTFEEQYTERVKQRIAGIEPKDYTRMGPFVRHAASLLNALEARTKLLITLSDSKPEDWDGYKGDYGIEDTRKALIEAAALGIHPFCVTIDHEAPSYLPHLFGAGNYILIDDVRDLPGRITDIYRRLTA